MSNENANFDEMRVLQQIFNAINIIPANWKKIGDVYRNELNQPVFICLECLNNADGISSVFKANDGLTFLHHIQQQHNTQESIDKISEEIRNFEINNNKVDKNDKNSKLADLNVNKTKEQTFLENVSKNIERNHHKFKTKSEDKTNYDQINEKIKSENKTSHDQNIYDFKNIVLNVKQEDDNKLISSHCNYYVTNDDQKSDNVENDVILITDDDDAIIISDEEMDQDEIDTMDTGAKNNEDNNLTPHPVINIPTFGTTPSRELLTNGNSNDNSNDSAYNIRFLCSRKKVSTVHRPFQCKKCGRRTLNKANMKKHLIKIHNFTENINGMFFKTKQPNQSQQQIVSKNDINLIIRKKIYCKICKREFKSVKYLERHQILYHSRHSYLITKQCEICHNRIFFANLEKHMLRHKNGGFKCEDCESVYFEKSNLNRHIRKFHLNKNSSKLF